jgi:hypothetical protein
MLSFYFNKGFDVSTPPRAFGNVSGGGLATDFAALPAAILAALITF